MSQTTVQNYSNYLRHVADYMEDHGVEDYSLDFSKDFLAKLGSLENVSLKAKRLCAHAMTLVDRHLQGLPYKFRRKAEHKIVYPDNELGRFAREYITFVEEKRYRPSTFEKYQRVACSFSTWMTEKGYVSPSEITREDILAYVSENTRADHWVCTIVSRFVCYLKDQSMVTPSLTHVLDGFRMKVVQRIPSYFLPEEVLKIEAAINRGTSMGKRDYAMILLASRLGMRASDICNLQLDNLDWKDNKISIIQKKTGKQLELPLLEDAGNAIIDYLRYARPATDCTAVFLTMMQPYRPLSNATLFSSVAKAVRNAGISAMGRRIGPHGLRHSLATAMMGRYTPIQVISTALGHSDTETTMVYLTVDVKSLLECAHDVPPVEESFYTQKGGAFYV